MLIVCRWAVHQADLTPGNAAVLTALEPLGSPWKPPAQRVPGFHGIPLGRGPDGGLWLRGLPWAVGVLSTHMARAALVAAGDPAGGRAVILGG